MRIFSRCVFLSWGFLSFPFSLLYLYFSSYHLLCCIRLLLATLLTWASASHLARKALAVSLMLHYWNKEFRTSKNQNRNKQEIPVVLISAWRKAAHDGNRVMQTNNLFYKWCGTTTFVASGIIPQLLQCTQLSASLSFHQILSMTYFRHIGAE